MLTYERAHELFSYSASTGQLSWKVRTSNRVSAGDVIDHPGRYISLGADGRHYLAHRVIWLMLHGEWPDQIDHIDHNGRNNRPENLRSVTAQLNLRNQKLSKRSATGICGVSFRENKNKYRAYIFTGKQQVCIGHFDSLFDAACARRSAELAGGFHINHGCK